jgi:hypothetical protein
MMGTGFALASKPEAFARRSSSGNIDWSAMRIRSEVIAP